MKKIIFLLSALFSVFFALSQNTFISNIITESPKLYMCMAELPSKNYLVFEMVGQGDTSFIKLYKIKSYGKITDSIEFSDSLGYPLRSALLDSNTIIIISKKDSLTTFISYIDTNMNLIKTKKYQILSNVFFPVKINCKNNDILCYYYGNPRKIIYINENKNIDTIYNFGGKIYDLNILDSNYFYIVYTDSTGLFLSKKRFSDFQTIDSVDLGELISGEGFVYFLYYMNLETINDRLFLNSIIGYADSNYFDIVAISLDSNFNPINIYPINTPIDERQAAWRGFDSNNKTSLYIVNPDAEYINGFQLTKLDTNLNIIFQKFISFTVEEFASIFEVLATADGGAIVATNSNDGHRTSLYKFAPNGYLLNQEEHPEIKETVLKYKIKKNKINAKIYE